MFAQGTINAHTNLFVCTIVPHCSQCISVVFFFFVVLIGSFCLVFFRQTFSMRDEAYKALLGHAAQSSDPMQVGFVLRVRLRMCRSAIRENLSRQLRVWTQRVTVRLARTIHMIV